MKKSNRILSILLSLIMIMSLTVTINAEEVVLDGSTEELAMPIVNIDLEPETITISAKYAEKDAVESFTRFFSYYSQTDCSLSFQVKEDSKYKDIESCAIFAKKGSGDYVDITAIANEYRIEAKTKYFFKVVKTYSSTLVTEPSISREVKLNYMPIEGGVPTPEEGLRFSGEGDVSRYYTYTPSTDGGYLFEINPEIVTSNTYYKLTIRNKSNSLNVDTSNNEDSDYSLRVYLKAGTEYYIIVDASAVNLEQGQTQQVAYTFKASKLTSGSGITISGAESIGLNAKKECVLYPFLNRRAFVWYEFTAPKKGSYEFCLNNAYDTTQTGEIVAELKDSSFSPSEEQDTLYLYENEKGSIVKNLSEGESCYIQIAEQYKGCLTNTYKVEFEVKEHVHNMEIIAEDSGYVCKGCFCQSDDAIEYSFWLEKVSFNNATYTGKKVTPTPKFDISVGAISGDMMPTIPAKDPVTGAANYIVTVTSKNKSAIGTAKAKVKFQGAYKELGTYTASFKIVPKGTTLTSVKAGSKSFTAKWKKQKTKTTGYQIRYSTNSGMSSAKIVTIGKNTTLSKKVTKLKANTSYYVQVRTYKTVSGKKYYSGWSAKTLTTTN